MSGDKYKKMSLNDMRNHLTIFESEADYQNYLNSGDIWVPRVAFIASKKTKKEDIDKSTSGRVDFYRIGSEFAVVANDGTLFINDQPGRTARLSADGQSIIITDTSTGIQTDSIVIG